MNSKTKKFLLIVGVGLFGAISITLVVLVILSGPQADKAPAPEQEVIPIENGRPLKVITTKRVGEKTLVANYHDNYQLAVPKTWDIPPVTNPSSGLKISFSTAPSDEAEESPELHIDEGVLLTVNAYQNPKNLTMAQWLQSSKVAEEQFFGKSFRETVHPLGSAFHHSGKVLGFDENPLPSSAEDIYVLRGDLLIYTLKCWSMGEQFAGLQEECKEAVNSFRLLE